MSPEAVMEWSRKQFTDWQEANAKSINSLEVQENTSISDCKWKAPEMGCIKINVDAAVKEGQDWFAIGMVARNHLGHFLGGKTMKLAGRVSVVEVEMVGISEAMSWAIDGIPGDVVVESDSLISVQNVLQAKENLLEIGDLMQQCRDIPQENSRLSLSFSRNQANRAAHCMARIPCEVNSFMIISSPPSQLLEILLSESSVY